jgi:hypothetical protein
MDYPTLEPQLTPQRPPSEIALLIATWKLIRETISLYCEVQGDQVSIYIRVGSLLNCSQVWRNVKDYGAKGEQLTPQRPPSEIALLIATWKLIRETISLYCEMAGHLVY